MYVNTHKNSEKKKKLPVKLLTFGVKDKVGSFFLFFFRMQIFWYCM
jgi:hypothetical protein